MIPSDFKHDKDHLNTLTFNRKISRFPLRVNRYLATTFEIQR